MHHRSAFSIRIPLQGYEAKLATLSYSKIVIDEIQMYGPDLVGFLIVGLKMIQELGGKFAVLTATFLVSKAIDGRKRLSFQDAF